MKKTAIAAGLVALAIPAAAAWADVSEKRELEAFSRVEFDGIMDIDIRVGGEQSFEITAAKEKYLRDVKTRVRNGKLEVEMDADSGFFSIFRDADVRIFITVPALDGAELDGMGDMTISGVDADEFYLVLDGMGSVEISGACKTARLVLDGMGDLKARNFECERVRLTLDGMGDASVYASKYIDINLDGFGDVDVYGDPEDSDVREDGMGDITVHE